MIAELPWLEEVAGSEEDAEEDTDTTNHYIGNSQEWISSTNDRCSRNHQSLRSAVRSHVKGLCNIYLIGTGGHGSRVLSEVELAEGWQARRPHPILEVVVRVKIWGWIFGGITIWISLCPIWRRYDLIQSVAGVTISMPV